MSEKRPPATVRYNNPGAIKYNDNILWLGQTGKGSNGLVTFKTMIFGGRAQFKQLFRYITHEGKNTISAIIGSWSPGAPMIDTHYKYFVCKRTLIGTIERIITYGQIKDIGLAMADFEAGMIFPDKLSILAGYKLALGDHKTSDYIKSSETSTNME